MGSLLLPYCAICCPSYVTNNFVLALHQSSRHHTSLSIRASKHSNYYMQLRICHKLKLVTNVTCSKVIETHILWQLLQKNIMSVLQIMWHIYEMQIWCSNLSMIFVLARTDALIHDTSSIEKSKILMDLMSLSIFFSCRIFCSSCNHLPCLSKTIHLVHAWRRFLGHYGDGRSHISRWRFVYGMWFLSIKNQWLSNMVIPNPFIIHPRKKYARPFLHRLYKLMLVLNFARFR